MEFTLEVANQMLETVPLLNRAKLEVVALDRGYVKVKMPIEGNGNHFGVMYAGNLYSISEYVGAGVLLKAVDFSKAIPLAKSATIDYLAPAMEDVFVELRMSDEEIQRLTNEVAEHGKSEYVIEPEVTTADGTVVAKARGTYQLRSLARMPGK